jgi:hypothetical protein
MARTGPECHAILPEAAERVQNLGGIGDETKEPASPAGSVPIGDPLLAMVPGRPDARPFRRIRTVDSPNDRKSTDAVFAGKSATLSRHGRQNVLEVRLFCRSIGENKSIHSQD